jgi:hypothetical protein
MFWRWRVANCSLAGQIGDQRLLPGNVVAQMLGLPLVTTLSGVPRDEPRNLQFDLALPLVQISGALQ